jgi:tetratricopeptide (TPR) repeat protein
VRSEILNSCDMLMSFDKDSSTWAYLENVSAPRIRRVMRGLNTLRYNPERSAEHRKVIRKSLGFQENDFVYLQSGPLELESGALDSIYALKCLLQSHPSKATSTKLVFSGTGSAGAMIRQRVVEMELDNSVFFVNPNEGLSTEIPANHFAHILAFADVLLHNPIAPSNASPQQGLDCTLDILTAVACGVTVISNGSGWVGEWISRFYKVFPMGNIHSQSKLMCDARDRVDRFAAAQKSARKALENEHNWELLLVELLKAFEALLTQPSVHDVTTISRVLEQIDSTIKSKQYLRAVDLISQAFSIPDLGSTTRSHLFRSIGDCFVKLGDMEGGLQNYAQALQLDPYCAKTYIGLGTIALQTKSYNIAVPQFQKAVSLAPKDDMASLGLALAFEGLGEKTEALKWTARSCNINIDSTVSIYNLVKLSYDLEEFDEAQIIVARYTALHPHDVNMLFTLAGLHFKKEETDEAVKLAEEILKLDPMNGRAHALLQQISKSSRKKAG